MEWRDQGIVLSARKHGETSAVAVLLTREHGRHAGLVRGGAGKRGHGVLQPGTLVDAVWRARLAEHLGTYALEAVTAHAAPLLSEPVRLAALSSACALTDAALAEREPHRPLFDGLLILLQSLSEEFWPTVYVQWELGLLMELGFGLDLSKCAATGTTENLTHVSPKSGRAVSAEAAAPYKERLLVLPAFLLQDRQAAEPAEIADALRLTGYFLETHVFHQAPGGLPDARKRLAARIGA